MRASPSAPLSTRRWATPSHAENPISSCSRVSCAFWANGFLERFPGRLINIHPSLLPAFPGVHTHRRALAEGVKIHGCTVHFVTPRLDHGPIIAQAAVPVLPQDTEESLAARVLEQEHVILPQAVRWFIEGRLHVSADRVLLAGAAPVPTSMVSPVPS